LKHQRCSYPCPQVCGQATQYPLGIAEPSISFANLQAPVALRRPYSSAAPSRTLPWRHAWICRGV